MTTFSSKHHIHQLKRCYILLILFIIFRSHTSNAQFNHKNVQTNNIGQNWKRDTGGLPPNSTTTPNNAPTNTPITTPITTPLRINLTFEKSLMQWNFPIEVGTPPQPINMTIGTTSNLLWVVSEFCMNSSGNACKDRTTNFFDTSLSNTISGDYPEFTIKYIKGSVLSGVEANDTIIINKQTFEQLGIGLPIDINGTENVIIPVTTSGQIGLMPYQNNQIVGMALSMSSENAGLGGIITLGGINSEYIIGNNESNIVYQHLPQITDQNQQFSINVTNVYINNNPINLPGLVWFDSGIQNIQLDDNSAKIIINNLPGGNYSNGIATVDCNISNTFGLFFEIANQKWRLPSSVISKNSISGTNKCESIITGGANDGSWIFGSAFITNFYMVFDQKNSQFGIASRSDINYGPTPISQAKILVQVPDLHYVNFGVVCLKITDQEGKTQAFTLENIDPNGYYHLGDNYLAQEGFNYSIGFYTGPPSNNLNCSGKIAILTPYFKANVITGLWDINRKDYSVGIKVQIPNGTKCLHMSIRLTDNSFDTRYFPIDGNGIVIDGYYHINDPSAYVSFVYTFEAYDDYKSESSICWGNLIARHPNLSPDITNDPWAVPLNGIVS
ncbi:4604_t:CDS:2 [Dentiscutata heterogama]|uniref:4604_t:CDS:1 n=1 Tax=Dentiscutata heterogama TaxID=1316150 RepID=A0ACA9KB56_9GLOM|nr:4604_t:CDS:2 [Dentiscutata heterogama]